MKNRIENSSWLEGEEQSPRLFKTEGKLHFDQAMREGDRLASLSFNMSDYERLVYTEQIATQGCNFLTYKTLLLRLRPILSESVSPIPFQQIQLLFASVGNLKGLLQG